jgi:hypothetical protein
LGYRSPLDYERAHGSGTMKNGTINGSCAEHGLPTPLPTGSVAVDLAGSAASPVDKGVDNPAPVLINA